MPHRTQAFKHTLLLVLLLLSAKGHSTPCNENPGLTCLAQHIESQIEILEKNGTPLTQITRAHWEYESLKQYQEISSASAEDNLTATLRWEDGFIQKAHRGDTNIEKTMPPQSSEPFHDLLAPSAYSLLIEQLTLQVRDADAASVKRMQLDQKFKSGTIPNSTLIRIARHEILGGAPDKGIATLSNTQIDEFSDIYLFTEKHNIIKIGDIAKALFLNPEAAKNKCEEDKESATHSVTRYYSKPHNSLLNSLWNTPDINLAWKNQMTLALLYKNAETCTLFVNLHVSHMIQTAMSHNAESDIDILSMIFLYRAIRRYIT